MRASRLQERPSNSNPSLGVSPPEHFCLLIGGMKCGTTALYQMLGQHPEIARAREKEPDFFSRPEIRERGFDGYQKLWDFDPDRHRWALEASTSYSKLPTMPNAAAYAWNLPGEFRFVYVVRDPVERIRSQYLHSMAAGWFRRPITEGVTPNALMQSDYEFQLRPYELIHGREAIHVMRYEELGRNRKRAWRSFADSSESKRTSCSATLAGSTPRITILATSACGYWQNAWRSSSKLRRFNRCKSLS